MRNLRIRVEYAIAMSYRIAALVVAFTACAGCTTIGADTKEQGAVDYGPPQTVEICLLKDPDVTQQRADELIAAINKEFAPYGIQATAPWVHEWKRPSFTASGIIQDVMKQELEVPCDRLVGLVDRNAGDFLWGLLLPEVLGAVEDVTRTRGYVVANWGSVNQIFSDPGTATVHEFYHLVGCGHGVTKSKCYHKIAEMKASLPAGSDFLPGVTKEGKYLLTREEANDAIRKFLAERRARKERKRPDQ
jgi:hypothetical protein